MLREEVRFTNIKVCCPRNPNNIYKMEMTIVYSDKTGWIPLPCNGCDEDFCGCIECMKCTAAVTEIFIENPLMIYMMYSIPTYQSISSIHE